MRGPSLLQLARETVSGVYGPATRELESQIAAVIPDAKKRAEFMQQVFTNFANFLKAMLPDVQAIYQRAAQDIAQFAQGQQAQIAGQEASSAAHISDIAGRIGAPAGQAPQDLQAAAKYYATFGALPARTLEESGAGAARYFAELPGIFLQAGAREIAKVLEQAAQREKELRLTLADIRTRQASDILRELESLRAQRRFRESLAFQKQQARQRQQNFERQLEAQIRNADLARRERILGIAFQNGKITFQDYARLLGLKGWKQVPDEFLPTGWTSVTVSDPDTGSYTIYSWPKDQPPIAPTWDPRRKKWVGGNLVITPLQQGKKKLTRQFYTLSNGQVIEVRYDPTSNKPATVTPLNDPLPQEPDYRYESGTNKKGEKVVTAIDPSTGKIVWQQTLSGVRSSASRATEPKAPFISALQTEGGDEIARYTDQQLERLRSGSSPFPGLMIGGPTKLPTAFQLGVRWVNHLRARIKARLSDAGYKALTPAQLNTLTGFILANIESDYLEALSILGVKGKAAERVMARLRTRFRS
jgi:hypothetical protein